MPDALPDKKILPNTNTPPQQPPTPTTALFSLSSNFRYKVSMFYIHSEVGVEK